MAKKRLTKQQQARRAKLRTFVRGLGLATLAVGLAMAWVWHRTLPLERVDVAGNVHAAADDLRQLAGVAPDSVAPVALYRLDLALIADRVRRHPWVREARLRRLPTGTLRIAVEERQPAVLVVARDGSLSHTLDREGFAMPIPSGAALENLPLLRGAPAYHPTQPIRSAGLRELVAALADADEDVDALVSEVAWTRSGATLTTVPVPTRGPLPVRLGRTGHADALARLGAFWHQAVLPRPDVPVQLVDLRYEGQVVTREAGGARTDAPAGRLSHSAGGASEEASPAASARPAEASRTDGAAPEPAAPSPGTQGPDSVATPHSPPTP